MLDINKINKVLILGVTAVGKGSLAFDLAKTIGGEIISIDSMKVYRRMDIGTAKPSPERRSRISYHLIDVVEPSDAFSVDQFLDHTRAAVSQIQSRGKHVIACGGTAMYIKALLYGLFDAPASDPAIRQKLLQEADNVGLEKLHLRLCTVDPEAAGRIHRNDQKRIIRALEVFELTGKPISHFQRQWSSPASDDWLVIGLKRDKEIESKRINLRVKLMIEKGLKQEVESLLSEPAPLSMQAAAAIGYAEMIRHIQGRISLDEAIEQIKVNSRKLAKAQRTWFKTFQNVHWIELSEDASAEEVLQKTLSVLPAV